jgi:LmbE family N-acetylglucosaminyl deacetylase
MNGPGQPPGWTERVRARGVLVLAPHSDDEVLGCGGLLAQLAAAGAAVRVLFLTDSAGGTEAVAPDEAARDAYRQRRREEAARACEALGIAGEDALGHLGLPDGSLDQHLEAAEEGIRRALVTCRPDLLLVPSPLEVSRDHRAAFAAFHRVFAGLRDGYPEGVTEAARGLRILVYEVNHPAYPDLLVDVSAEAGAIERAMAAYASQEERHPYLNAGLGLRRFRTLSLGAGVELAEAYRRLTVEDLTTRSPAQLVRRLGGLPEIAAVREGPKMSVVVRTRNRPGLLAEALESLAAGEYRRAEVVLVNDGGSPPAVPAEFPLPVVRVDLPENVGRASSAQAGVAVATGDFISFLDDDDLAAPEHLATLARLVSAPGVRVAYTDAAVAVYELTGDGWGWECRERRLPYSRDFDPDVLAVDNYIPFNTLAIDRQLFAEAGPFDSTLPFFEDWDYLIRLAAVTPFHHLRRVTCEYRHFRGGGHHIFGERPRERGDFLEVKSRVLSKHAARLGPDVLARAVDTLRAEIVAEREALGAARREATALRDDLTILRQDHDELARDRGRLEERYHALNGELQSYRIDHGQLRAEAQRLYDQEKQLRAAVDDQTAHLGRTYAEIERLNRLIKDMQATRAWRLHQWMHRGS